MQIAGASQLHKSIRTVGFTAKASSNQVLVMVMSVAREWENHQSDTSPHEYARIGSRKAHIDMMMCLHSLVRVSEGMLES